MEWHSCSAVIIKAAGGARHHCGTVAHSLKPTMPPESAH
jgi:hypothetical protein